MNQIINSIRDEHTNIGAFRVKLKHSLLFQARKHIFSLQTKGTKKMKKTPLTVKICENKYNQIERDLIV